jgi:hypothetical protein
MIIKLSRYTYIIESVSNQKKFAGITSTNLVRDSNHLHVLHSISIDSDEQYLQPGSVTVTLQTFAENNRLFTVAYHGSKTSYGWFCVAKPLLFICRLQVITQQAKPSNTFPSIHLRQGNLPNAFDCMREISGPPAKPDEKCSQQQA